MAFQTDRPVQIVSIRKNKRVNNGKVLLDVVAEDFDRGFKNLIAFEIWNPSEELKGLLKEHSDGWLMFSGAVRSREGNRQDEDGRPTYFTSLVAFNSSIVVIPKDGYQRPVNGSSDDF